MEPMDVTEPAVYDFVHTLYTEIAHLFPDQYIHIGGDEGMYHGAGQDFSISLLGVLADTSLYDHSVSLCRFTDNECIFLAVSLGCWKQSKKIQNWIRAHNLTDEVSLLEYFEKELISFVVDKLHKRPISWQDPIDDGAVLPKSVILDIWKSWTLPDFIFNATRAGYDVLFSACWYLDHVDQSWWTFHACNPRGFPNATDEQLARVLGGHASQWGETIDETNFYQRAWPRASSTAEVLWSGSPWNHSDLSLGRVATRLDRFRCLLVQQFDIPAAPIQPGYCEFERIAEQPREPVSLATDR
jgi:hexosaminidase